MIPPFLSRLDFPPLVTKSDSIESLRDAHSVLMLDGIQIIIPTACARSSKDRAAGFEPARWEFESLRAYDTQPHDVMAVDPGV